jgi:hypothetical protein
VLRFGLRIVASALTTLTLGFVEFRLSELSFYVPLGSRRRP